MNWIERLYEIKGKDLYSQNGEGLILEYIFEHLPNDLDRIFVDIGGGDFFYLSNTRHLRQLGYTPFKGKVLDKSNGHFITVENIRNYITNYHIMNLLSIDIDGNDYWILEEILKYCQPEIICAEFNPSFTDSRTIKYNPNHIWDGTDYYGFSFEAGKKLAEENGYKVIFQIADMNMIMVRSKLVTVHFPEVTFKQNDFFPKSNREDWVMI